MCIVFCLGGLLTTHAQHSSAREWNEVLLEAIRHDYARPTVHARNLLHTSIAMYDAWAAYDCKAEPFFLGNIWGGDTCEFAGLILPANVKESQDTAISYAMYRLLSHRFKNSPGAATAIPLFDETMIDSFGMDTSFHSTDYLNDGPAALGNYIAERIIQFGLQDGANEQNDYGNLYYESVNPYIAPVVPGNPDIIHPNRWQAINLAVFIDQSGNPFPYGEPPPFLSPEWGNVVPFALDSADLTIHYRDSHAYWVYHDPGDPPYLDTTGTTILSEEYKWGHALVAIWSSHLDPTLTDSIDISPASFGNTDTSLWPINYPDYRMFYDTVDGGDPGTGWALNPVTGLPYEPQMVPLGDYARVLAEFWADGPDSETPPGHWFTILNYVNDHPQFEKRFEGNGDILDDLEWDVKAYLCLAGAMHDCAVAAWGAKGWYDYLRPISAIRMMADYGQCTDTSLSNYHVAGLPLRDGLIEVVDSADALAGFFYQNVGKIKLFAWKGPDYIFNPNNDVAGVGWILAENWWPYQRPTFVTPPFAGYVSGHSTFSRAAAEVMTLLTGTPFFPGGMGEFHAPMNEFLVFEDGPSMDVTLQWATYRDASDQTSLSRIWGGIHPPCDDIPGRQMGVVIGPEAFNKAKEYFDNCVPYRGWYSIDPSKPRTDSTFSSLQEAFSCLSACGMSGQIQIGFPYGMDPLSERIVVDPIPGNSPSNPVILRANNTTLEMLDNEAFDIHESVYLKIKGNLMITKEQD